LKLWNTSGTFNLSKNILGSTDNILKASFLKFDKYTKGPCDQADHLNTIFSWFYQLPVCWLKIWPILRTAFQKNKLLELNHVPLLNRYHMHSPLFMLLNQLNCVPILITRHWPKIKLCTTNAAFYMAVLSQVYLLQYDNSAQQSRMKSTEKQRTAFCTGNIYI
jgi:hypothetical protein